MVNFNRLIQKFVFVATPLLTPFTIFYYRSQFNRKVARRIILTILLTPVIGYFRTPYVLRKFKNQLEAENTKKQEEIKQTLESSLLDFTSSDNNFDYMILVKSQRNYEDEELYLKQKTLFNLNNQILNKISEGQNYFQGIKFMFLGQQKIYDVLKNTLPKEQENQFDFIKRDSSKSGMFIPEPDSVLLVSKDDNGDKRILMEWPFDQNLNLKTIARQITKHKHKKYVQSMNF